MPRPMRRARAASCRWRGRWRSPGRRTTSRSTRYCPGGSIPTSRERRAKTSKAFTKRFWHARRRSAGATRMTLPASPSFWRLLLRISLPARQSLSTADTRYRLDCATRCATRRLVRLVADDGAAAHHALQARLVEAGGAVQRAAVVPHDALARRPAVRVDPRLRRDRRIDVLDERAPLVVVHALDGFGMVAEENRLAPGLRVRAHDRMRDRGHLGLLFRRQRVLAMATRAREIEIVDGVAPFDLRLDR